MPLDFASRRRIGYLPEERRLYPKTRIAEQLSCHERRRGSICFDAYPPTRAGTRSYSRRAQT